MKITIEKDEIGKLIAGVLKEKFGGDWEDSTASYYLHDHEFVQITPEYLAEKEVQRERSEAYAQKCREEDEAAKVEPEGVGADVPR